MSEAILIGAQKAGTSSLYDWITKHPDVYGNIAIKDYHFFSNPKFYSKGIKHYQTFFKKATSEKILFSGAVNYLYFSKTASENIYNYNPETKLIVLLRDPIHRAYSAFKYFKKNGEELSENFLEAIKKEESGCYISHEEKGRFNYLDHGNYYSQLKDFLSHFSREQIHIVFYEKLIADKTKSIQDIFKFLEVNADFIPEFRHLNKTGKAKSNTLNKIIYSNSLTRKFLKKTGLSKLFTLEQKIKMAYLIRKINTKASKKSDKINIVDYEQLRTYFDEEINKLDSMVSENLSSLWHH